MTFEQYTLFARAWMITGVIVFAALLFITAPYGRHTTNTWGPLIDNKWGWFLMEFSLLIVLAYFIFAGSNEQSLVNWIIIGLISFHYINRSFIFPLRIRTRGKKMPVSIILMGIGFNLVNGFLFGYYLGEFRVYPVSWLHSPQFITGLLIFIFGMILNWQSDAVLIHLRKPGDTGYKIPQGRLFQYISCPNLLGEVIEWLGFAILSWSLPGLAFFVWTFANLVPRALSHHKWYLKQFENYPPNRKAIFPAVW